MSSSGSVRIRTTKAPLFEWALMLSLVVLAKMVFLLVDPNLRIYMGDSASYLKDAIGSWNPPDRSMTYPELIGWSAVKAESAFALVVLQTLMGVGVSVFTFWVLRTVSDVRLEISALAALLVSIEPLQLFYERMVMAESAGLFSFLAAVGATVCFVHSGKYRWAPAIAILGIVSISFRHNYLPVVIGLAVLTPFLRLLSARELGASDLREWPLYRFAIDILVVASTIASVHLLYQHAYGARMDVPPTYLAADGQMRIALVAPLIEEDHFEQVGLPRDFADEVDPPLDDNANRGDQIWSDTGLWSLLKIHAGEDQAEEIAEKLTLIALRENFIELIPLGLQTVFGYFDNNTALSRLKDDQGAVPPDEETLAIMLDHLRYNAAGLSESVGPIGRYFVASRWWMTIVLFSLAPLALGCLISTVAPRRRKPNAAVLVLGFVGLGLVASHLLFSHIVSFRYLHPMPVFFLILLAFLVSYSEKTRKVRKA
mgnify:CR=1 FL=1